MTNLHESCFSSSLITNSIPPCFSFGGVIGAEINLDRRGKVSCGVWVLWARSHPRCDALLDESGMNLNDVLILSFSDPICLISYIFYHSLFFHSLPCVLVLSWFFHFNHFSPPLVFFLPLLHHFPLSFSLSLSAVDRSGSVGSGQPLVNAIRTDSALIGGTEPFHPVALYWNRNVSSCSTRIFLFGTPLWQIISQASPPDIYLSNTNIKNTSVWLFWTDRRSGPKKVPHHLLLKLRTDVELQRKSKVMCQTRVHLKLI